ncbi:MAG TPA: hypothetical protein VHU83_00900 [Bryobacteraceae bacterium]|nr:hypothetical protein [Bryobacteraceae bacterium]
MKPRSAQQVIDAAIEENRPNEYLLYVFAIVSFLLGGVVIVWSLYRNQPIATLAGAVESALFAPAVYFIRQIRRENMRLRMLELPLSSAHSAEEAGAAIVKLFADDFGNNKRGRKGAPPKTIRE